MSHTTSGPCGELPGKRLLLSRSTEAVDHYTKGQQKLPANPPFAVPTYSSVRHALRSSIRPPASIFSTTTARSLGPAHPRNWIWKARDQPEEVLSRHPLVHSSIFFLTGPRPPPPSRSSMALPMPLPTKRAATCIVCSLRGWQLAWPLLGGGGHTNLYGSDNMRCCNIRQRAHLVLGYTRKTVSSSSKG